MQLGRSIKEVRQSRNLSQVELAKKSGLAQNVISRIERDQHKPTESTLKALANAMNVDTEVFHFLAITTDTTSLNGLAKKLAPAIHAEIKDLYNLSIAED
mgnify:CR=1 FL=1|tara:strand:- start:4449 stop:4748 length:300 start_codon:yes stop_codon:yes gene_type:complete